MAGAVVALLVGGLTAAGTANGRGSGAAADSAAVTRAGADRPVQADGADVAAAPEPGAAPEAGAEPAVAEPAPDPPPPVDSVTTDDGTRPVLLASAGLPPTVVWPADGPLTGWFGERRGHRQHDGIDIYAPVGAPVRAAAEGTVVLAGAAHAGYSGYGTILLIDQGDGVRTLYAHLSAVHVARGDRVAAGERVGAVGTTGSVTSPHLHFEVRVGGGKVDPSQWLASAGAGHRSRYRGR